MKQVFEGFSQSFEDDGNYIDTFSKDDNNLKNRIQACSQVVFSSSERLKYFSPDSKTMEKILRCFPTYKSGGLSGGKLRSPWYIYNSSNATAYAVQIKDVICLTHAKRDICDYFITPQFLWENNYIDKKTFVSLIENYLGDYYKSFFENQPDRDKRIELAFTSIRDIVSYDNTTNLVCMIGYLPALDKHIVIFSPDDNVGKDNFLDLAEQEEKGDGWGETKGYYEDDWNIPGIGVTTNYRNVLHKYFLQSNIECSGDMDIDYFLDDWVNVIIPNPEDQKIGDKEEILDYLSERFFDNNNSWRKFYEVYYNLLFDGYLKYLKKNIFSKYEMSNLNECFLFDSYSILWEYVRVQGGSE